MRLPESFVRCQTSLPNFEVRLKMNQRNIAKTLVSSQISVLDFPPNFEEVLNQENEKVEIGKQILGFLDFKSEKVCGNSNSRSVHLDLDSSKELGLKKAKIEASILETTNNINLQEKKSPNLENVLGPMETGAFHNFRICINAENQSETKPNNANTARHLRHFDFEIRSIFEPDKISSTKKLTRNDFKMLLKMKIGHSRSECSICFEGYRKRQVINVLPCGHKFHRNCVKTWFQKSVRCPLCRLDIKEYVEDKRYRSIKIYSMMVN